MVMYNIIYNNAPPNLLIHPIKTRSNPTSIREAHHLTNKVTATITIIKDNAGSQRIPTLVLCCSHNATVADNFIAAARPMIMAIKENTANTRPFCKPLTIASTISIAKMMSIITLTCLIVLSLLQKWLCHLFYPPVAW